MIIFGEYIRNNMARSAYWQTNKEVSKELNKFLFAFCNDKPELKDIRGYYCNKKTHLNGIQFYAGFIAGTGKKWQRYCVPIALIFPCFKTIRKMR